MHAVELLGGARGEHPPGMPTAPPRRRRDSRGDAGSSPAAGWVEAKAVRVIGAPPCEVGNAMSIVPGGEVRGTLGCAEFDARRRRGGRRVRATGRPRSERSTTSRATSRSTSSRTRRRRGWSSSRPPTSRGRCSVRWSDRAFRRAARAEDGAARGRRCHRRVPRGDRTGSGGRGGVHWTTTRRGSATCWRCSCVRRSRSSV